MTSTIRCSLHSGLFCWFLLLRQTYLLQIIIYHWATKCRWVASPTLHLVTQQVLDSSTHIINRYQWVQWWAKTEGAEGRMPLSDAHETLLTHKVAQTDLTQRWREDSTNRQPMWPPWLTWSRLQMKDGVGGLSKKGSIHPCCPYSTPTWSNHLKKVKKGLTKKKNSEPS